MTTIISAVQAVIVVDNYYAYQLPCPSHYNAFQLLFIFSISRTYPMSINSEIDHGAVVCVF